MSRKKSSYPEIVREISEIFEQGREGARESGNKHTLYANWKIGDRIVTVYLYPAIVERVTDADTVILQADLGFGITARERFRLRGVNMSEKDTEAGRRAARKVEQKLKSAPIVVIRTYGTGVHGRYVVDILYQAEEKNPERILKKGKFLNQELIRAGYGA